MEKLTDFEKSIVEQMLHILQTCIRDEDKGIGFYQKDGKNMFFVGLCNLVKNLTIDTGLLESLRNYLPSYSGPKNPEGFAFWFTSRGPGFFGDRIQFLEYVLEKNTNKE